MKLLFVTSEANPFAASGGLGDVMGALPKAITDENKDIEVDVILPLYNTMKEEYRKKLKKVADISFNLSWRSTGATVYKIKSGKVNYLFVENHYYFDRERLYGEWDDGERFAFFSKAVVEYILQTKSIPDVLHANDWQCALAVIYLKTLYSQNEVLQKVKTLYTIHNIEYQGKYGLEILSDLFGLGSEHKSIVEYDGCINLMKGAITVSDLVSTVSPNYARELKDDFFAFGLAPIIRSAEYKMHGVINGIDYDYFSPKNTDIAFTYDKESLSEGKAKNKAALQEKLGLKKEPDTPLISMITRLTAGKGIDLVLDVLEGLLSKNVQLVILGTGDKEYEDKLSEIASRHTNFSALIKFDRVLSKEIYAASDIFLMPSKSEPCGLAQMIACSYGTVPIVRAVGGLEDSIIHYGNEKSNGFKFANFDSTALWYALEEALRVYSSKEEFDRLRNQSYDSDFTWGISASKYITIYNNLLK